MLIINSLKILEEIFKSMLNYYRGKRTIKGLIYCVIDRDKAC